MTFWLRRWQEQSRTPTAQRRRGRRRSTCTSTWRAGVDEPLHAARVPSPKACCASARALANAAASSSGASTRRMPRPPPPAVALIISGKPIVSAWRAASSTRVDRPAAPGRDRHAGLLGEPLGRDLVAEAAHASALGPDEDDAEPLAQLGERRVLGHEAPADPGGVGAASRRARARARRGRGSRCGAAVASRRGRAEAVRLVGVAHEHRLRARARCRGRSARIGSLALVVELAHGVDEPHRGLAAVDDRQAGERRCSSSRSARPSAARIGASASVVEAAGQRDRAVALEPHAHAAGLVDDLGVDAVAVVAGADDGAQRGRARPRRRSAARGRRASAAPCGRSCRAPTRRRSGSRARSAAGRTRSARPPARGRAAGRRASGPTTCAVVAPGALEHLVGRAVEVDPVDGVVADDRAAGVRRARLAGRRPRGASRARRTRPVKCTRLLLALARAACAGRQAAVGDERAVAAVAHAARAARACAARRGRT